MSSKFDYVKYDDKALGDQADVREDVERIEAIIKAIQKESEAAGRACAIAITKLEEVYMWVGKAIRDAQVERHNG